MFVGLIERDAEENGRRQMKLRESWRNVLLPKNVISPEEITTFLFL